MMFSCTEEQALLRSTAQDYFGDLADANDRGWSREGWSRLANELGLVRAPYPEQLGGSGGGIKDGAIVMEALGEHLIALPYLQNAIMAGRLFASLDDERGAWLAEQVAAAEMTVAIACQETETPCLHDIATTARSVDGGFRLNGCKILVRAAPWSSHLLVSARTGGDRRDEAGISLFLIETDRKGVALHPARTIDDWAIADVELVGVLATQEDLVGLPDGGHALITRMMLDADVALCAEAVGVMRAMADQTLAYARQRKQFGAALADFQVIQHRLADMRCALERADSIAKAAAHCVTKDRGDHRPFVAAARHFVDRALNSISRDAVQIHGAIGMMDETPLARYFKRATAIQLQPGCADHLAVVAAAAGFSIGGDDCNGNDILQELSSEGQGAEELSAFRNEVRTFLDEELTPDLREMAQWDQGAFSTPPICQIWQKKLLNKGWAAPSWPTEHGGPGWSARQRQIFEHESAIAGAPRIPAMGLQMAAPVIMRFGTDEQKARFLPKILNAEEFWCQGYSEPGAGSDLAAVQLAAVRDGDEYVLNGTKIWTTFAHFADWIFLLARTAKTERKQAGISFLLVPMSAPGITVTPLISISGEHEVNQVFFDDVRIPACNRVGEENGGWEVAKYLLEFERGVGHQVPELVYRLRNVRDLATRRNGMDGKPLWETDSFRRRFAALEIRVLAIRLTEERLVYSIPTGENVGNFAAALMKLSWSEAGQEIDELMIEALGPYAVIDQGEAFERRDRSIVFGPKEALAPMRRYLNDRVLTIAGGSSEVLRTIVARML